MTKCEFCAQPATEPSGYCFTCAEEVAVLMYEAGIEFGATPQQAAKIAQGAYK